MISRSVLNVNTTAFIMWTGFGLVCPSSEEEKDLDHTLLFYQSLTIKNKVRIQILLK